MAILTPKSPSCSTRRLSHPTPHPPPENQHHECTDPGSPPSHPPTPSSPHDGKLAEQPGSPRAWLPLACLWRKPGPLSALATTGTYCCRIKGRLTQLAAATAAKGTHRASKGGARCGRQAGISAGEGMWAVTPASPLPAYLGVEVESHRSGQGCTGGHDISHPNLPGQQFPNKREKKQTHRSCSFGAQDRVRGVFMGLQGGPGTEGPCPTQDHTHLSEMGEAALRLV